MYERQIKDKRIEKVNFKFLTTIEYMQPEIKTKEKIFETLAGAQKYLRKFPPDVWDGFDMLDGRYREVDERRYGVKRRKLTEVLQRGIL